MIPTMVASITSSFSSLHVVATRKHTKSLSTPLAITYNPLPQLSSENISKHFRGLIKYLLLKMWVKENSLP
jgi:hypothetical protein